MSAIDDRTRVRHMLDAAAKIVRFVEAETFDSLVKDERLQLALIRLIEIIGEAASRVSDTTRKSFPNIPWAQIIAMRNRLIHGYFEIDLERIWYTATKDAPALVTLLKEVLDQFEDE